MPLLLLGAPQALNYLLPGASLEKGAKILGHTYLLLLALSLPVAAVILMFPQLGAALLGNPKLIPLLQPIALYLVFIVPTYCLDSVLIINNQHRLLLYITVIYNIIFLAINGYFGWHQELGGLFQALIVLALLKFIVTMIITRPFYVSAPRRIEFPLLRELGLYFATLAVIALLDMLTVNIDKYLVAWFFKGNEQVYAIYSLGALELPLVIILLGTVSAVIMPEFSRLFHEQDQQGMVTLLHNTIKKLHLLIVPTFFYFLVSSHLIIPLLFTTKYLATIPIFCIYLLLLPIRSLANHPLLIATGMQKFALWGRIIDLVANITLGVILVSVIGYWGPAISTVLATYIHKVYQTAVVMKHFKLSLARIYPWGFLQRILVFTVPAALIAFLLTIIFKSQPWLGLISSAIAFIIMYMGTTVWQVTKRGGIF